MSEKIKTIVVDTLTTIQENQYGTDKKKPNHDKWKDYGQEIFTFYLELQKRGFEVVLVNGHPGTGKSSGMHTLPSKTNIWFNADNKNPVWTGGKAEYGRKTTPKMPYHCIPHSYSDILRHLDEVKERIGFEEERVAFLLGHVETFKEGVNVRSRLKTLGNLVNKLEMEGRMETVLYSAVKILEGKPTYLLSTQNNGLNTARSPQGLFDVEIPNDYALVYNKVISDY